ncbi:MAG: B12-binding domain-containing radical SAM protein, partial [Sulfolobales archaeon]
MNTLDIDIAITTDRTMMSDHHGKEFLGFMATGPSLYMPEFFWMYICCPKPKVDKYGRPHVAPYGLRKVEAKLIDEGFKAAVIDPDYIDRYLDKIKILMIGHHDYFAYGPPSSEWWLITKKTPVNRKSFIKFLSREDIRRAKKKGLKIVAGGPAAWQWFWEPNYWESFGVDVVIDGESERILPEVVKKLLNGESVPRYIYVGIHDAPSLDEISTIKGPSVNGLVEIMRGCPRGCSFCSVTLRPLRHYPLEKIEKEILVNVRNGVTSGILHSDDVLLYGAKGVVPNPDALIKVHELALKYYKNLAWSHASLAAIVVAQREYKLITKLTEMIYSKTNQDYLGVEVGIETGSVRLAKIIMPAKAAPYRPEDYPSIVEEAFS